jgi:NAD(P)-dependent dehydrogenase (short-subunit alcohol dehydrogenase family)
MNRFAGKVALVSGAASGIGLATARALVVEGAQVVLADIAADRVAEAAREIGSGASGVTVDVSDPASCERMVAEVLDRHGTLDIAINNAGVPSKVGGLFEDADIGVWDRLLAVNLSGVFYAMRAEVPSMRKAGGGVIVNTASVASVVAAVGMPAYIASKHGVAGLTKAAALDLASANIRVNAVCPGFVRTGMTAPLLAVPDTERALSVLTPIGRIANADEIARAILFLAHEDSSYATGALLMLDGGLSIQ